MASVKYVGPHDASEVPSLADVVGRFVNGVAYDVPDERLGTLRESCDYEIDGKPGQGATPEPAPPVDTTTPENQPTEPAPPIPTEAPAEPAPAEGN